MMATKYGGRDELELSATEKRLLEIFTAAGRNDLADALKRCRKYHKLKVTVGCGSKYLDIDHIWGLRQAFLGDDAGDMPESREAWVAVRTEELKDDPLLQKIRSRITQSDAEEIIKVRERAIKEKEARQRKKDAAQQAAKEKADKEKEGSDGTNEKEKHRGGDKGKENKEGEGDKTEEEKDGEGIKVSQGDKKDKSDNDDGDANKDETIEKEGQKRMVDKETSTETDHEEVGTAASENQSAVSGAEIATATEVEVASAQVP